MNAALSALPSLMAGLFATVMIALSVIMIATIAGMFFGLVLSYGRPLARLLVRGYVDVIRGIPLLVLIFLIYYGLPALGANLPSIPTAILALSIFKSAQVAEVARGGLQAIPGGQHDAAKALGLNGWQRFGLVILPQVVQRVLPPWINLVADTVKDTALLSLLGVVDLMLSIQQVIGRTYEPMPIYVLGIAIYFSINFTLSVLSRGLEVRAKRGR
ncbi:amino acid ABC transporter permease [Mesorhizobium sp. M3A.F.Ca.ET.201.01.1.1]|uniref:amino acid ABC transporter permease n=1 Tax=Mesorhizobium sp. M3A.F.Ca.ET.201.01.1.1 TaxID=2563946 RepID=UPI001093BA4D|nr:amino acid ABC transporter permease [Mesorhizobium sp. M3A.F.Ca.ET.201.01.1.1]TGS71755.1 amino acid ABC transporter permease [Mesorhizobium sp. M3A.F.Ca.ET.201.01.1.1]